MKRLYPLDHALAAGMVARRRALRWSQNRLALEAALSEGLVAKLETLRVPYSPEHLRAVEAALTVGEAGSTHQRVQAAAGVR